MTMQRGPAVRIRHLVSILATLTLATGTAVLQAPAASAATFAPTAVTPLPSGFKAIEVHGPTGRVFVSSPASNVVTVLDLDGDVIGGLNVAGAGALLLDAHILYVASSTAGRIDAFDTATLNPVASFGGGTLVAPNTLVKAGGRLWTTTGTCGNMPQLASIDVITGVTTVHASTGNGLSSCPFLFTSPVDPNIVLGFDAGISPTTVVRYDVSTGAPVVKETFWAGDNSNSRDAKVLPDGQTFALASGSPYVIRTLGVNPLNYNGVIYPTGHYPNAVEATAAGGGMLAAGRDGTYDNDIDVFRLGNPAESIFRYDFRDTGNTLKDAGLAFSPDGTRLFAVSGNWSGDTAMLNVFGPLDAGGRYTPLSPARILDTRDGTGGISGRIGSGATVDVQVAGRGGVPTTGVSAVAVNVTVTRPTAAGFLTIYPAGGPRPLASNVNFTPDKTVPNLVVVKVGVGGRVSMFNSAGATDVIYDVAGWFSEPGTGGGNDGLYAPLVPARILDTRDGTGGGVRLGPGASLDLQVAGRGGVPATSAAAAVLNVAATGTTAASYLTVHPTGEARPLAANLNFIAGDTVSNRAMVKLGTGGRVTIYNNAGSTDVVVDVGGWFGDASATAAVGSYTALAPARLLDTRDDTGGVSGPVPGGGSVSLQVTGRGGVPATGVSAVILNVTAVDPTGPGYLTISPSDTQRPLAADLNYAAGETRPNLAVARIGGDGRINLFTSTGTQLVVDVAGWMSLPALGVRPGA